MFDEFIIFYIFNSYSQMNISTNFFLYLNLLQFHRNVQLIIAIMFNCIFKCYTLSIIKVFSTQIKIILTNI